jgi:hypothetical protein
MKIKLVTVNRSNLEDFVRAHIVCFKNHWMALADPRYLWENPSYILDGKDYNERFKIIRMEDCSCGPLCVGAINYTYCKQERKRLFKRVGVVPEFRGRGIFKETLKLIFRMKPRVLNYEFWVPMDMPHKINEYFDRVGIFDQTPFLEDEEFPILRYKYSTHQFCQVDSLEPGNEYTYVYRNGASIRGLLIKIVYDRQGVYLKIDRPSFENGAAVPVAQLKRIVQSNPDPITSLEAVK